MSDGTGDGRQGPFRPPLIELLPAPGNVFAAVSPQPERPRYGLALALFALTFFCTTTLGPVMVQLSRTDMMARFGPFLLPQLVAQVWRSATLLRMGLTFSVSALTILLAHEMGHYVTCRHYRIPCTLPYFLPVPFNFGTFGAFIKIKAPIYNKQQLFDVGIAGPIAGFLTLIPFLLFGIARSHPAALIPASPGEPGALLLLPGRCLAIELTTRLFHGQLPAGTVLDLHPAALAAWLGLLATAINLLPLGQLDGGHILYAATGRLQRRLALPLWLVLGLMGTYWWGWLLWCIIILVIGLQHPPVYDETMPLDGKRRLLALLALAMFLLAFMPVPIQDVAVGG